LEPPDGEGKERDQKEGSPVQARAGRRTCQDQRAEGKATFKTRTGSRRRDAWRGEGIHDTKRPWQPPPGAGGARPVAAKKKPFTGGRFQENRGKNAARGGQRTKKESGHRGDKKQNQALQTKKPSRKPNAGKKRKKPTAKKRSGHRLVGLPGAKNVESRGEGKKTNASKKGWTGSKDHGGGDGKKKTPYT